MRIRSAEDLLAFFAELEAWSDEHAIATSVHRYGAHPDQHAELRLPGGYGPHPVALVVHGGFWRAAYGLDIMRACAIALSRAGWATWNLEYRRVGSGGGYPETLEDAAAARRALANTPAPLDLDRVVGVGHSAGGHISLWLAAEGLVAGACSLGGVCDLVGAAEERVGDGAALDFMDSRPEEEPGAWARADPLQRLPIGVPALLVHGVQDGIVPVQQSRDYTRAARAAGDDCAYVELECGHFDVIDPRSSAWPAIERGLAGLLG